MNQILQVLKNSSRFLITTHTEPDGDAIGSTIALGIALLKFKKKVTLYTESPIPAVYGFLQPVDKIVHRINGNDAYDAAIILDCGNLNRVGEAVSIIRNIPVIINIDHHVTNTGFGHFKYINVDACACTEIIYNLIKAMNIPISNDIATSIYTGILTDTGSFRFSNTNKSAFRICDEMIGLGVDPYIVAQHVYGTYSMGRLKLLNLALDSIEMFQNGKISIMTITRDMLKKTETHPEDVDGFINYARRIEDVKVAILIHEMENSNHNSLKPYHVSLRSDGTVDVATIASTLGGGGHFTAAGFSIESTLSEVKSEIIRLTRNL